MAGLLVTILLGGYSVRSSVEVGGGTDKNLKTPTVCHQQLYHGGYRDL